MPTCTTVPNFVQVGQAVPEIWPYIEFFKMAAVRYLGFSKVRNFNCLHPSGGQNASPCQILCRSVKALQRYGRFRFFSRWRPSAILDFKKVKILTAHTLRRAKVHHPAKFCANRSRRCRDMAVFVFFKMAAVRHLGFSKVGNFNCPYPSEGQNASSYRILCRSVEPLRRYGRFRFFKMAAVRHLGFVIRVFGPPTK